MCGIAGQFGGKPVTSEVALAVERVQAHRGPDGTDQARFTLSGHEIFLHHGRLAILDLNERARQPFRRAGLTLVFNGEIYNYKEIREELWAQGSTFTTESDTEVVLEAYRRWGETCVEHFEGMWALALADEQRGGLWLSRDRFGEKPLFWLFDYGRLIFASEIKGLAALLGGWPEVDYERLQEYLVFGYRTIVKHSGSWYRGVSALPAGTSAFVTHPNRIEPYRYWSLNYHPDESISLAAAELETRERLERALSFRLRADVPIAFCLSGGIDSSLLACLAMRRFGLKVHAFSIIDSDWRYNESGNIDRIVSALGCRHTKITVRPDGFFDRMDRLIRGHDGPVATSSYYVHSFLSEAIAQQGYKVAISGTGADELFSGYYDHYLFWLAEQANHPDFPALLAEWKKSFGRYVRNPFLKDPLLFVNNPSERGHLTLEQDLFNEFMLVPVDSGFSEAGYCTNLLRNRMLNELFSEIVPVILAEDDLNSMMWGIENRSPFLDRSLAEFAYSVPNRYLIQRGYSKWLLRAVGRDVVPDEVRLDRRKRGFNFSIKSLIDCSNVETVERLLAPGPIFDIVRRHKIESFLRSDMTNNSLSKFLFSFVSTRIFLDQDRHSMPTVDNEL